MVTILILILGIICALIFPLMAWMNIRQFDKQREEWNTERSKLLDRIQAGSFVEYKAQERAATPIKRKEKDSTSKNLEKERWL